MPEHVLIKNRVYLYAEKGPWVASGKSVQGALEYDQERDLVKCHECGDWFKSVGVHSEQAHNLTAREYKAKHGLSRKTALISEGTRAKFIKHHSGRICLNPCRTGSLKGCRASEVRYGMAAEGRNLKRNCQAQLIARVNEIASKLGRTPTESELQSSGVNPRTLCKVLSVRNTSAAMEMAGLAPRAKGNPGWQAARPSSKKYSKSFLIESIRNFYVEHQRVPSRSDHLRGLLPCASVFVGYFGSMKSALVEAGFGLCLLKPGQKPRSSDARPVFFPDQMRELKAIAAR